MNLQQKQKITEDLLLYKKNTGVNNTMLGKMTGVKTYIGYILQGKYEVPNQKGHTIISDEIFSSLQMFLKGDFVLDNANLRKATTCLLEAKEGADFRLLLGETGRGKTFACEQFVKEFPKETFLITCDGDMKYREFVMEICKALHIQNPKGTVFSIRKRIVDKLSEMANPILILDEAENLTNGNYKTIKALTDKLKYKCAIVLVGANKKGRNFQYWLEDQASAGRANFPQVSSRFSIDPVMLESMTWQECQQIAKHYNVADALKVQEVFTKSQGDFRFADWSLKKMARRNMLMQ